MTDLADQTATEAAEALRRRQFSVRELVESVLKRAERTEPMVHAYSYLDVDGARGQADAADAAMKVSDVLPPLHGIPIGVKDVIDVRGTPTTGGSRALGEFPAAKDADVVRALRAAGAIVLGKTVAHELGFGANVPPTRNAWDQRRAPGGSSAGSAVAVAVGSALAALGTDTGGSVRVPAALNGIVGFKPTTGTIDLPGVIGMSVGLDTIGTLTRTADDATLLFDSIVGRRQGHDPGPRGRTRIAELDLRGLAAIDPEISSAVRDALVTFIDAGARVEPVDWPHAGLTSAVGIVLVFADSAVGFHDLTTRRWSELESGTLAALIAGGVLPNETRRLARRLAGIITADVNAIFSKYSANVLAMPSFPVQVGTPDNVVPGGGSSAMTTALELQMIANIVGLPAVTIPCGATSDGLPIGLQLIGQRGADRDLLMLASQFQRHTQWHLRRPAVAVGTAP